jgi:predicted nucleic acid-binding Zn ribbon protein
MPLDPVFRKMIATFRKSPSWDPEMDLQLLQSLWPTLAGPGLASATTIVALHGSRIVLNVPDKIWQKQLLKMKPQLLDRLNEPWSSSWITDIAFTHEN